MKREQLTFLVALRIIFDVVYELGARGVEGRRFPHLIPFCTFYFDFERIIFSYVIFNLLFFCFKWDRGKIRADLFQIYSECWLVKDFDILTIESQILRRFR